MCRYHELCTKPDAGPPRSCAGRSLKIYSPYVKQTAVLFEYEVPSTEEFTAPAVEKRLEARYPYLVAEQMENP